MINILTRESILNFNIGIAHYTLSHEIKSPYISKKHFYNRYININTLFESESFNNSFDKQSLIQKYKFDNDVIYNNKIEYLQGKLKTIDTIKILYKNLKEYNKKIYNIYEEIEYDNFLNTFLTNSFHHFIIRNKENEILNYVTIFTIKNNNLRNKKFYTCGYLYNMFFNNEENPYFVLEMIFRYINKEKLDIDMVCFTDVFENKLYDECLVKKLELSSSFLNYHFYNIKCNTIENNKNGLITI